MAKTRICRGCYQPFAGRRDARTCSPRCRKRLQRTRDEINGDYRHAAPRQNTDAVKRQNDGTSVVARPALARRAKNLLIILLGTGLLLGMGLGHKASASVSQGFVTDDTVLRQNMAVALTGDNSDGHPLVRSTSVNDTGNALGVAVGLGDSLLAVSPISSQVYVISGGPVKVYASDLNGKIHKGDLLAVSPLRGILMKSTDRTLASFGVALEDFNDSSAQTISVKDKKGSNISVKVSLENINIAINPPMKSKNEDSTNWLTNLGSNLTGQQISGIRVLAALAIFFTLMVIEGEIIYSTVSSSITALGRNPLARSAIAKQSLRSAMTAAFILLSGIGVIAMLIWI
jgi:hypothetical protein